MATNFLQNRSKLQIILPTALVVIALLAIGGYFGYKHTHAVNKATNVRPVNTIDYTPAKRSDNAANELRKAAASPSKADNGEAISPTLNSSSTAPPFSVTISRANSTGQSITAAANVNGVTTGSCVFNFSQTESGQPQASSSPESVQPSNQSSMCPPLTVRMPSKGKWYVSVSVTTDGKTVTSQWAANPINL